MEKVTQYYGAENVEKMKSSRMEDEYISFQMHDDFILSGLENVRSMPPKQGSKQIDNAIENGFDICSVVGGNSLFPKLQLLQLNSMPLFSETGIEERVVVGNSLNIAEMKQACIAGKRTTPVTDAYQIINSENLMAAKFVVLSLTIPEIFVVEEREEYLENQNDIFRKLFADFQIDKPVFITTNSPDQKKLRPIFEANIDLERALTTSQHQTPLSEVE